LINDTIVDFEIQIVVVKASWDILIIRLGGTSRTIKTSQAKVFCGGCPGAFAH